MLFEESQPPMCCHAHRPVVCHARRYLSAAPASLRARACGPSLKARFREGSWMVGPAHLVRHSDYLEQVRGVGVESRMG